MLNEFTVKVSADLGVGPMADFCEAEGAGDLVVGGLLLQTPVSLRPGSWIMPLHRYSVTSSFRYFATSLYFSNFLSQLPFISNGLNSSTSAGKFIDSSINFFSLQA
jgi:hypothetical protein